MKKRFFDILGILFVVSTLLLVGCSDPFDEDWEDEVENGGNNDTVINVDTVIPGNVFVTGVLLGKFSVSAAMQVQFSQGNLQYQASTNTWRFAENQWDYVGTHSPDVGEAGGTVSGSDNVNISQSYSGWIDLFGWGTSGYNHGATCYQPWSTSTNSTCYFAYGQTNYNLFDQSGQADWGYNAIINGGSQNCGWRTMTHEEWSYLLNDRNTSSGMRFAKARVNNVNGVIVLPDNWNTSYYSLKSVNQCDGSYSDNSITASQWVALEQNGAVFLPAAGLRIATDIRFVGWYGNYWSASSSIGGNIDAWGLGFQDYYEMGHLHDSELSADNCYTTDSGRSVRLVRSAQ